MIFSCNYDSNGNIVEWSRGNNLTSVRSPQGLSYDPEVASRFGVVSKYPDKLLKHPDDWILKHAKVAKVNSNGTVEVELHG
jgi:hypothetical protein